MLHLAPDHVHLEAAVIGDTRPLAALLPDLMAHGVRAVSPSGVLGDPTGASATEGHRTMDTMVSAAVRRITAWTVDARGRLAEPVPRESAHQVVRP
jgi:creatinine amidohydrolase